MKNTGINHIRIEAENLGGLAGKTALEFKPGINVIEAPNASGKTSIIGAFTLSVLPPREAQQYSHILHSAESRGGVKLSFNEHKIERTVQKKGKEVELAGSSVASGDELGLIRRYAVADEHNPVLAKVRAGENLKGVLSEYSGVEELKEEQEKLLREKSDSQEKMKAGQEKIKRIDSLKKDLKDKEDELGELDAEKKELKTREKKPSKDQAKLVELEGDIARKETDLKNTQDTIKTAESLIKSRKQRVKAIELRAAGGTKDTENEIKELEGNIEALGKEKLELERKYSLKSSELAHLRFIVSSAPAYVAANADKLSALISDEEQVMICPVCDHETKYGQIKSKQQKTDDEIKDISNQRSVLDDKINKLNKEIAELKSERAERAAIEGEKERLKKELNTHEKLLSKKKEDLKNIEAALSDLVDLKKKLLEKRKEEASESEKESIDLERNMAVLSSGIDRIRNELKLLESAADDLDKIQKKYEGADKRTKELASEIEEREKGIVRIFNTEIETIYKKMEFKNIDKLILNDKFELNVVRKKEGGGGYSDTHSVKSLSKTEREVAGIILLLSGYRAFNIAEKFPIFVVDEVSFMDARRLKEFVDYTEEMARAVILATIPGREIDIKGINRIILKT